MAVARKRPVETFAPQPRLLRKISHALRLCHDAERISEQRRIASGALVVAVKILDRGLRCGTRLSAARFSLKRFPPQSQFWF